MKIICNLILALVVSCSFAKGGRPVLQTDALQKARNSHVNFTRNDGQIDTHGKADCRFTTGVGGAQYFFCADGVVGDYQEHSTDNNSLRRHGERSRTMMRGSNASSFDGVYPEERRAQDDDAMTQSVRGHVLKLNFLNRTNFLAEVTGQDEQEYKCNYFIGNDSKKWHTNVPSYSRIVYKDVWEGIDVAYHSSEFGARGQGNGLEYDVIVHPGANPAQIQFSYEGQDALSIDSKGNLVLKTSVGDVIEQTPYVYQIIDGVKKDIPSRFIIQNLAFSIRIGEYDPKHELVVDPAYSTYLGGNGSDQGNAIAIDSDGNAYVTGSTTGTGNNFPTTPGAYNNSPNPGSLFAAKMSPEGKLIYSALIGGSLGAQGYAIAVDMAGNAYITGNTRSKDYPVTSGAYDTVKKREDQGVTATTGFITKLGPNGTLVYSTYLGGSLIEYVNAIAVDTAGCVFVAGSTESPDFPATLLAYDITHNGVWDGFVTKMNSSGSALIYSTFLGGNVGCRTCDNINNFALGIAIDHYGNAYVTGNTSAHDFPTTPGAFQDTVLSTKGSDGKLSLSPFITKLNSSGTALVYSTYLSGSKSDSSVSIAVDKEGNAYVTGRATSSDFPVTDQTTLRGGRDAFVTKIKPNGDKLAFSTFLGGSKSEDGWGIAVDAGENVYVTGNTGSSDFPTTADGLQRTFKGSLYNMYVTKIRPQGDKLSYSTYLGGQNGGQGSAIASGSEGNVYVTGRPGADFPITNNAYQKTPGGSSDAFVTKFSLTPIVNVANILNFDSVYCSEGQIAVLIENLSADVSLKIDTMMFSGPNATNFSFVTPPKFPLTINPLGDTQFVLQLTRTGAAGLKTAFLNIHSNDDAPGSDTLKKVTLIGVIDSIGIVTPKKNITFGQLRCEEVSFDTVVQVKNKGLQPARVVPTVSGNGATSFTVTPSSATIAGGAIGNFTVHFQPSGNGSFSAHIKFSDDACEMISDTTYVTGSKISDVSLSSSPSLIDFVEHCHSSVVDSFIIVHNTSNATVTLDPAVMSGSGFTVLAPTTSVTLLPDSSVRFKIRFTSTGAGNYQGRISMMGKPCNISVSNQLRGIEIEPPKITLNPKTVFFDTLDCSEAERFTKVKVKNVGGRTITLKPVIIGDTHSYNAQPNSITIPKNSSFNVKIIFHPDNVGQHSAYLFFDDMLCGLLKDSVSVRAFQKSVGAIAGKPLSLRFDTMNCSDGERDTMSLWIKNTGDQILNLNPPTVSGNGFVIENANGVLGLAPLDSIEYRIIFTPGGEGTYLDTFRITGTCGVLFSCPLTGVCDYNVDVKENSGGNAGEFFLGQNHPNPFSQLSVVSCQLSGERSGIFEVRDMLGRVVYQRSVASATTQLTIDAGELPNGVYLYTITDGTNILSRMMTVMK